jgi:succinyl-diaminopimelate desuccinylase
VNSSVLDTVDLLNLARDAADELVEFARHLIQIPSLSGQEGAIAAAVQEEMQRLGYDEVGTDTAGNVIGLIRGRSGGRSIMLHTHLDHVSPGDAALWIDPPYSAAMRDGAIYGRGAVDIKGSMASQVYVARLLRDASLRPAGDLYVVGAVQEEIGGLGTKHLVQSVRTDYAVVGEPSSNTLRLGHRGRLGLIAEVRGRAAHASAPNLGINPHYALAAFLLRLQELPMRQQELFGGSSVAPTLYSTDNASSNVIPSTARVFLDWRNVPAESPDDVLSLLRLLLQAELPEGALAEVRLDSDHFTTYTGVEDTLSAIVPSYMIDEDDQLVRTAQRTLEKLLRRPFLPGIWRFATDGGRLFASGIPTIGFGPGDETQAHMANEHIEVAQLVEALAANAALVLALGTASSGNSTRGKGGGPDNGEAV